MDGTTGIPGGQPAALIEARLTSIWTGIFGLTADQVDPDDSLFEIGGTSVQAVQLATRITEAFDVSIDLKDIFAGGIRDLAALIWQASPADPARTDDEEYASLLAELESVSEEEAVRLLQEFQANCDDNR